MNSKFYVSLEVARLLKEKGYDIKRDFLTPVYKENGCLFWTNHEDLSDKIPAITKAEAIDWLDSKEVYIQIGGVGSGETQKWSYSVFDYKTCDNYASEYIFPTRLEAEEAAIIKALELL
jgi:hypothetical protein